jgi:hypothetical protein
MNITDTNLIGRRYQLLKPKKAPEFFAWAVKNAPAKSSVQRLAQAELDKAKVKR